MIVCCGEALVDVLDGDETRAVPGGGPMNAAVAAARLEAPSAFVGRVSTDGAGQLIWRHLQRSGVDLRACERGAEPTARAIVSVAPHPSFRFEGDSTADTALEAANLAVLGDGPHILHGGTLGMFRGRTAEILASLAERHDGLVSLDPNVRPAIIEDRDRWDHFHERWLHSTDLYRASDEDLAWIWPGRPVENCAEEVLGGRTAAVVVTRGASGATVYTRSGQTDAAAPPVDVVDTVGAGDAFVGSMLASLWARLGADRTAFETEPNGEAVARAARERSEHEREATGDAAGRFPNPRTLFAALELQQWRAIAERAVATAALTCTRRGADPPGAAELETALAESRDAHR